MRHRSGRDRVIPILSIAVLMLVAMGAAPGSPVHAGTRVGRGSQQGPATLIIAEPGTPDTLNPYLSHSPVGPDVASAIFDSLITITPSGSPRPDLAQRWARSGSGTRWTFWLNSAARWQDGEPVTADDVLFTARLVTTAAFGATSTAAFDRIKTISAVGKYQVTVELTKAYAPFPALFGTAPILPAHVLQALTPAAIRDYTAFNRRPIGSGPFVVAEFVPGDHVTLAANPDYFGGPAHLDRLVFQQVGNRSTAITLLRHRAAVLVPPSLGLTAAEYRALQRSAKVDGITTIAAPSFSWTHIDLVESGLLKEAAVRRALTRATPKKQIVDRVLLGLGTIAGADQPPSTRWFEPTVGTSDGFDPAQARRQLANLGFHANKQGILQRGGQTLAVTLWGMANASGASAELALIAGAWRQAGVGVTVRQAPASQVFGPRGPLLAADRFHSTTMNAVLYTWTNPPDPDDSAYWHSAQVASPQHPDGTNFVGYHSPVADHLLVAAQGESNLQVRTNLYQKLQLVLARDQPAIFIAWLYTLSAAPAQLHGYLPNPYLPAVAWNAADWTLAGS